MTAKAKLETLTNSWYGFAIFSAACALLSKGIGVWSIITTSAGLMFWLVWVWFWGNRLQNKSSLSRWILIIASGVQTVLAGVGTVKATLAFVHSWELSIALYAVYSVVFGWMMAKSFRTLTDSSVKAYFA